MARLQTKNAGGSHQGSAGSSGIPCATVLRLIARSPRGPDSGGPGFLAPVVALIVTCATWSQRRETRTTRLRRPCQDRSSAHGAATQHVHCIPRSRFVTIAKRPSRSSTGRADHASDLGEKSSGISENRNSPVLGGLARRRSAHGLHVYAAPDYWVETSRIRSRGPQVAPTRRWQSSRAREMDAGGRISAVASA
jgi:hypothetical protein